MGMIEESVTIIVSPKAEIKVEANGYKGDACLKVTAEIVKGLGDVKKVTKKTEFYDKMQVAESVKIKT